MFAGKEQQENSSDVIQIHIKILLYNENFFYERAWQINGCVELFDMSGDTKMDLNRMERERKKD